MKKGQRVLDFSELRNLAAPHWDKLSPQERDKYKDKANNCDTIVNKNRKHFNSFGQDTAELEAESLKESENNQIMLEKIKLMLDEANDIGGKTSYNLNGAM